MSWTARTTRPCGTTWSTGQSSLERTYRSGLKSFRSRPGLCVRQQHQCVIRNHIYHIYILAPCGLARRCTAQWSVCARFIRLILLYIIIILYIKKKQVHTCTIHSSLSSSSSCTCSFTMSKVCTIPPNSPNPTVY